MSIIGTVFLLVLLCFYCSGLRGSGGATSPAMVNGRYVDSEMSSSCDPYYDTRDGRASSSAGGNNRQQPVIGGGEMAQVIILTHAQINLV